MTDTITDFISTLQLGDVPPEVVTSAKQSLRDLIGVAAAGTKLPASRITRSVAAAQFGGQDALFLFDGRKASPAGSALANSTTIDGFDAHDGHPLTKGHAGCGTFAALVAFAGNGAAVSGEEALVSLIVGYEIAIRAGIALHASAAEYHTSGAWVAIAAAAMGARTLGFDAATTHEALGIAEYNGPRSPMMRCIEFPTMIKDGSGWGAMVGVTAAYLAREGFTGAPAATLTETRHSALWSDLGTRWRMLEQYMKPYPVCRWAQPAVEAAASLKRGHAFEAQDITGVKVRTFNAAYKLHVAEPRDTDAAQYSTPFPLAAFLAKGKLGPDEIDGPILRDETVLRLSRSVELIDDPRYSKLFPAERWAEVEIALHDGRVLKSEPSVARGSAENPLSEDELSAKFRSLMEAGGVGERAGEIDRFIAGIEQKGSVEPLLTLIGRPPAAQFREAAQ
ncbi:MAG TPA: MmgE/PrpD family protein [Rhizobiaceae bacterium]|nr:MmgE/PrpD family protein [Rhizobiaceae bacterium]